MTKMKPCPLQKRCGGRQYQGIAYEEQLKKKEAWVRSLMGKYCEVHPISGMDEPYHYRNKVHAAFRTDKKENIISGVYVSCNPETLAREVDWLEKNDYKAQGVWPVDMFPHTEHVEVVSVLHKTK